VLSGGKFENGAVTAAFGYLFNQAASRILRGPGHHKVTNEIAGKYPWSKEALDVFDDLHTNGGGRIPVPGHNFGDGHKQYNIDADKFVKDHLDGENSNRAKIDPSKMTKVQAVDMIKAMDQEPKLRNFNVKTYVNGIIRGMRRAAPKSNE
jgi:hypothetical protein